MLLEIHPKNPDERKIKMVLECLRKGGIIAYPTDTIYGLGCSIEQPEAINRICRIKNILPEKALLSFICSDLSHLSEYTKSIDTPIYRFLKQYLPGPYTFILPASKKTPKLLRTKKETVGIRVPDNEICRTIIAELGHPILSTSLPYDEDDIPYSDPSLIFEEFGHLIDIVIDGGPGGVIPSTIVDCTKNPPELIREGLGVID
ncbi:MAG TPA: L-threonylcarbamoyladenylate synthase [Chitinophagaceae bacterium]|jgi:tRNA threonylcarbamoyl adenosine modification protein (Sua5/YciO/YrdC/YwlC family)|nr:L-threonylcarbamoyladenylate synthase [Chitinophagaceae bacterium]